MSITTNPLAPDTVNTTAKRNSRRSFANLNSYQRRDLRSEYRFLRRVLRVTPWQAAGVIRRMADMATWR